MNSLPSPWPGDDKDTAIGVICDRSGGGSLTIELWQFGEDQQFDEFHSFDLDAALVEALGGEDSHPEVVTGPCTKRLQWSGDYRKALFSFVLDSKDPVKHVGVIDLETLAVTDITGARQGDESFGEEILDEEEANFEIVGARGDMKIDDSSVIISLPDEETRTLNGVEYSYLRVPVDDPDRARPAEERDARRNWFEPLDFDAGWTPGLDQYSLGGSWIATSSGAVEDLTAEGIDLAPSASPSKSGRIACTRDGTGVGWLDDSRFVVWDGTKLSVMKVDSDGSATCGRSLLPENDYKIADVKLSPDGRFVYLGWVSGAAEKAYRVPIEGGKPDPAEVPEPPQNLKMFQRALQPSR